MVDSAFQWSAFWKRLGKTAQDHIVVWTKDARRELIAALEAELGRFRSMQATHGVGEWFYEGFEVAYSSLAGHVYVHPYYVADLVKTLLSTKVKLQNPRGYMEGLLRFHFSPECAGCLPCAWNFTHIEMKTSFPADHDRKGKRGSLPSVTPP